MNVEELLGRPPVVLDEPAITSFIKGSTVLVTGAGGSIGSELCRQIDRFEPARLILVDRAEDNLFRIHRDLPHGEPCIGDVCDATRMEWLFSTYRPDTVLHAAAYKHVPMMETNAREAVRNNVVGTRVVADTSAVFGVKNFVLVSTDKAVNPASVMGATKHLAEMYVLALRGRSRTNFNIVRFGNVLGSTGSVVPIFLEQIARGGPVTITHPEMTRYFMTIPEACQLVLQAAVLGAVLDCDFEPGNVFVLDMGKPIRVVDLASTLIRRAGYEPGETMPIVYTGMRPGEKLVEELSREGLVPTGHPGILVGHPLPPSLESVVAAIGDVYGAWDVKMKLLGVSRQFEG